MWVAHRVLHTPNIAKVGAAPPVPPFQSASNMLHSSGSRGPRYGATSHVSAAWLPAMAEAASEPHALIAAGGYMAVESSQF